MTEIAEPPVVKRHAKLHFAAPSPYNVLTDVRMTDVDLLTGEEAGTTIGSPPLSDRQEQEALLQLVLTELALRLVDEGHPAPPWAPTADEALSAAVRLTEPGLFNLLRETTDHLPVEPEARIEHDRHVATLLTSVAVALKASGEPLTEAFLEQEAVPGSRSATTVSNRVSEALLSLGHFFQVFEDADLSTVLLHSRIGLTSDGSVAPPLEDLTLVTLLAWAANVLTSQPHVSEGNAVVFWLEDQHGNVVSEKRALRAELGDNVSLDMEIAPSIGEEELYLLQSSLPRIR